MTAGTVGTVQPPRRGLYLLDFDDATGRRLLVAVTSTGRELLRVPVTDATYDLAYHFAEAALDEGDEPGARLRLVE
jgi:hypothetical protein